MRAQPYVLANFNCSPADWEKMEEFAGKLGTNKSAVCRFLIALIIGSLPSELNPWQKEVLNIIVKNAKKSGERSG